MRIAERVAMRNLHTYKRQRELVGRRDSDQREERLRFGDTLAELQRPMLPPDLARLPRAAAIGL